MGLCKVRKPVDPVKQFRDWMKNTLRRAFFRYWERTKAIQAARVDRGVYKCAGCSALSKVKGMHIDHIVPVVEPKVGFVDWDVFISRLFCPASNLQLLCSPCHKTKTALEQQERKLHKTGIYATGKTMPVETKQKIATAHRGRTPANLTTIQAERKRPVMAYRSKTGEVQEFQSVTEAAQTLGVSIGNVSTICAGLGGRAHADGWTFTYKEKL